MVSTADCLVAQALMGGREFCTLLQRLREASPALTPQELPTLHAFSALAAELQPLPSPDAGVYLCTLSPACSFHGILKREEDHATGPSSYWLLGFTSRMHMPVCSASHGMGVCS
jgi:hypothetical protein